MNWRYAVKFLIGIVLIIVGLFALVTPFTPGAWLGLVGLEFIGMGFVIPRRIREPYERGKLKVQGHVKKFVRRY